jgi:hypothetical protein
MRQSLPLQLAMAGRRAQAVDSRTYAGLHNVFRMQLAQLPRVSDAMAAAVAGAFPSPRLLAQALRTRGAAAVVGIPLAESARHIGAATAATLAAYYLAADPNQLVQ